MDTSTWTRENLAWLAGLLEGEGYFGWGKSKKSLLISIQMTDEDVIQKAHEISACGIVCGPYSRDNRPQSQPIWMWQVGKQYDAYALMVAVLPFMGQRRREKITGLINDWVEHKRSSSDKSVNNIEQVRFTGSSRLLPDPR